jgi:hypothetical protein
LSTTTSIVPSTPATVRATTTVSSASTISPITEAVAVNSAGGRYKRLWQGNSWPVMAGCIATCFLDGLQLAVVHFAGTQGNYHQGMRVIHTLYSLVIHVLHFPSRQELTSTDHLCWCSYGRKPSSPHAGRKRIYELTRPWLRRNGSCGPSCQLLRRLWLRHTRGERRLRKAHLRHEAHQDR